MKALLLSAFPIALQLASLLVLSLLAYYGPKLVAVIHARVKNAAVASALATLTQLAESLATTVVKSLGGVPTPGAALDRAKESAVAALKQFGSQAIATLAEHGGLDAKAIDDLLMHLIHAQMPAAAPSPATASQR